MSLHPHAVDPVPERTAHVARAAFPKGTLAMRLRRAGIEGTLAQGTSVFGLRQARYRGFPKTQLQHVLIAIAMNLLRLVAWFTDPTHSQTQTSRFIALAPA
jgi:hypothetical protein